ncbi:hypothetical protein O181_090294 [Austropuccinia psidii MF-1]|uniref:Uncharacterized protein n=1 Tax=Austropuccinia psidii MF-1 TaxID=1389203 RepID=A0A9Q3P6S8_9BASI|nr:hypothetical protein [Austropuccinia psidii MF-1]
MTMAPPETKALQCLSLFMKDLSIVTCHLSKIMTSNNSSSHFAFCCWGRKPTTHSESWKKYCSQDKYCSYDSISLPPTAKIQSRSPKTANELSLRSMQPTGSQYISRNQERTQHIKCSKSLTEVAADHLDNTGSEVCSGNTTVKCSLDSDLSPTSKPNTLEEYSKGTNTNTIKKDKNPSSNLPDANSMKVYNKRSTI